MIENPVFIVGTERSGSNLLRLLLQELPSLAIPHPPHLLRDLTPLLPIYGDLRNDSNFRSLIADAARLVELHFAPWPIPVDREEVFQSAPRSLYGIYASIYEQFRTGTGKSRWGCKSTFMIHHVDEILRHHSSPRFLHIVRDPRDVAVSARNSVFNHFHPYYVASLWKKEQRLGIEWAKRLPASWLQIRYEDLLHSPKASLRRICFFLNETYSDSLLQFFETPQAQELATLSTSWENLAKPIQRANSGKSLKQLSPADTALVEWIAAPEMKTLAYELRSEKLREPPSLAERCWFLGSEIARSCHMEIRALRTDSNARRRLRKRLFLRKRAWLGPPHSP